MQCFLKHLVLPLVAALLLVAPQAQLQAQRNENMTLKPAVVFSMASLDEQLADMDYLLDAAGQGDAKLGVRFIVGLYADGLDRKAPFGGYVVFSDDLPQWVAFAPVTDMKRILSKLEDQIGEPEDSGDGVLKVEGPDARDLYIKEQNGFAFVSESKENLGTLPANPVKLLGGLAKKYNVAVRIHGGNIPKALKDDAIEQIKAGAEDAVADADEDTQELLKKLSDGGVKTMVQVIEQSEAITIGLGVDAAAKSSFIDINYTADKGSDLAKRLELLKEQKSSYAGFLMPGAAINGNLVTELAQDDIEYYGTLVRAIRKDELKKMDDNDKLSDADRAGLKDALNAAFDALDETLKDGKLDGGCVALIGENGPTFAAGGRVSDGAKLDVALKKFMAVAEGKPNFPGITRNADKAGKVVFHTMEVPIPDGDDQARQFFGEKMPVALGIGPKSVYMAFGHDATATLKKVISKSAADADQVVAPGQLKIMLTPIMKYAAKITGEQDFTEVVEVLKQSEGKDKIVVTTKPIERGSHVRIEIDEGVLQAIGKLGARAQENFGGGFGDDF